MDKDEIIIKPQTYWVVCRPTKKDKLADIKIRTIAVKRYDSIYSSMHEVNNHNPWRYLYKNGYRYVKVNLIAI